LRKITFNPDNSINMPVPFPRSYWVIPGMLLAGEYPGARDVDVTRQKIDKLLDAGVRLIANLMEPGEVDFFARWISPYEDILTDLCRERKISARMLRFSIVDMRVPTPEQMHEILDAIDESIEQGAPVYVHCLGGIGRTGTVVGCFLLRHGLATSENVLEKIARLRAKDPEAARPAPEASIQREFLRQWPFKDRDAPSNT